MSPKGRSGTSTRGSVESPSGMASSAARPRALQRRRDRVGWIDRGEQAVDDEVLVADAQLGELTTRAFRLAQGPSLRPG